MSVAHLTAFHDAIDHVPYLISLLPQNIIEDSQALNFKDVSKYMTASRIRDNRDWTFSIRRRAACRAKFSRTSDADHDVTLRW
jgi:hypothetical protein